MSDSNIKVVIFGDSASPHVIERVRRFSKYDQFNFFLIDENPDQKSILPIPQYYLELPSCLGSSKQKGIFHILYALYLLFKIKPDVIFIMYARPSALFYSLFSRAKVIISTWGSDLLRNDKLFSSNVKLFFFRKSFQSADQIYCVSEKLVEKVQEITDGKLNCVPRKLMYGLDTSLYKPNQQKNNSSRDIVSIYSPRWCKPVYNIHTIVEGVIELLNRNVKTELVFRNTDLAGSNESKNYCQVIREKIQRSGYTEYFKEIGLVNEEKRIQLFNEADIVISLAHSDGTPLSVLEAMAMGKIVVCGKSQFAINLINEGKNGYLVEKDDPEKIADKLHQLIMNFDEIQDNIYESARKFVKENADIEDEISEYIRCFEKLSKSG